MLKCDQFDNACTVAKEMVSKGFKVDAWNVKTLIDRTQPKDRAQSQEIQRFTEIVSQK